MSWHSTPKICIYLWYEAKPMRVVIVCHGLSNFSFQFQEKVGTAAKVPNNLSYTNLHILNSYKLERDCKAQQKQTSHTQDHFDRQHQLWLLLAIMASATIFLNCLEIAASLSDEGPVVSISIRARTATLSKFIESAETKSCLLTWKILWIYSL